MVESEAIVEQRRASSLDEPFLRELYAATRPEVAFWPGELREPFLAQQFEAQHTGYLSMFPESEHNLILHRGRPAGRIWVSWCREECFILDIALLPHLRRQGIGTMVIEQLLDRAEQTGVSARAHVERTNTPAVAFWAQLGFYEIGGDAMFSEVRRDAARLSPVSSASSHRHDARSDG